MSLSTLAIAVGLAVVVGAVLPMHWGWMPAALVLAVMIGVARARLLRRGALEWPALLAARRPALRWAVLGTTVFVAVVLASVCAQGVAAITVAQPGSIPAIALVLVAALVMPRLRSHGRTAAFVLAFAVPSVALLGARCEANGADARGSSHSGPIHGIHPFQSTAVMIDGYGPFDLPINDYVEPLGDRGYQPEELAVALELALHRIAQVHFADGPARARMAFEGATAGAVTTAPVQDRLDRDAAEPEHQRFWVRSGTTGQGSRVQFVCPGRRNDPRGPQPETVMSRMCPDKYANEASAGLGVTGRWPGYVEFRGNERLGLGRLLFGWTRSDDATGRAHVRWEVRITAWLVLALALALALTALERPSPRDASGSSALAWLATVVVGLFAIVVVVAGLRGTDLAAISGFARAPAWASPWQLPLWIGALVWPAALGLALWVVPAAGNDPARRDFVTTGRAGTHGWLVGAFVIVVLLSTDLEAGRWAVPDAGGSDDALPFETFVAALADRFGARLGLDILEVEAQVGALTGSVLALACIGIFRVVGSAMAAVLAANPQRKSDHGSRLALLGCALLAMALVVSRKTEGGSSLIPVAIGAALVLGSTLDEIRRRGPTPRTVLGLGRRLALALWIALALALAVMHGWPNWWAAWAAEDPLPAIYAAIGLVALLLPIMALVPDRQPRGSA